jgi:hypothetical protein
MNGSRRFQAALICQALTLLWAGTASAQESTPPPCSVGIRSALSELGCELRRALPKLPGGTLVVSAPLASDAAVKSPQALTSRLAHVVAGALGVKASDDPAALATARSLASSDGTLLHLQAEIAQGELRVVADLYPVPKSFWDRVRDPRPSPSEHAFASRRLDAELRSFFPPVPLVAKRIDKATTSEPAPVAVGCGDLDADGALEIVLVGRHRISVGRVRQSRFVPFATRAWADLSPLSRAPLREPIGSVWIEPGRHADIGISDRLETIRFTPPFEPTAKLGRRLPWPGGGCAHLQGLEVQPKLERCAAGDPAPGLAGVERASDALAGNQVAGADGRARLVRAARVFNEPTVLLTDDAGRSARIEGVGAQLAVGDLDGDGQPELVSGADVLEPAADALVVHTWYNDGRVSERLRLAVPTGVRALAVCPPDSAGLSAIALATAGALWIVR